MLVAENDEIKTTASNNNADSEEIKGIQNDSDKFDQQ